MALWAQKRLPGFIGWSGAYIAIGFEQAGEIKGAVVFTNCTPTNINAAIVLDAPLTRQFLRAVFYYPFLQLKVKRITALVDASNEKSMSLTKKLGFKQEGRLREAAVDGGDTLVFGILHRECKYLP
jgi:RimJ/RimL family protein N-acetyltransferase